MEKDWLRNTAAETMCKRVDGHASCSFLGEIASVSSLKMTAQDTRDHAAGRRFEDWISDGESSESSLLAVRASAG